MTKQRIDALLVSSVPNIIYLTNFSHFSKDEREAFLFITFNNQYVLTDGRYTEAVKNHMRSQILSLPKYELVETSSKLPFEKALKALAKKYKIKKLSIEESNLTVREHKTISKHFNNIYHFSVSSHRIIKDQKEIAAIEKACKLGDETFKYILNRIKRGITEKQLAFEIEFYIKKAGAYISFPPIVAFGKNSAIPHHKASDQHLASSGQFILLDFGVKLNNYCSDMTRTVFFGKPTVEQKRIYKTVLKAQQKAIRYLETHLGGGRMDSSEVKFRGIKASRVDKVARNYILEKRFPTIPHSLGHGVGLEVHESPRLSPKSKDILKPGMVFTIEPGIYIPGFGGVRIEDVVLLEENHPRLLTESTRDLIIL